MTAPVPNDRAKGPAADIRLESADPGLAHLQNVDINDKALNNGALDGTAKEHSMGFIQGIKTYKRAAMWSMRE